MPRPGIPPSPLRDRVGYFEQDRFRGYFPFTRFRPTTSLSTLRSAVVATTQDSVRGCELGFAAVAIAGD
jgi:hypothetical protein